MTDTMAQEQRDRDNADCTVAICRCSNVVFATVTDRMDGSAKHCIGKHAAAGCSILHMAAYEVRTLAFGCECHEKSNAEIQERRSEAEPSAGRAAMKFRHGQLVRHVKTGRVFRIVDDPARCRITGGGQLALAYSYCLYLDADITLWVRPQAEVEDGRFEAVT